MFHPFLALHESGTGNCYEWRSSSAPRHNIFFSLNLTLNRPRQAKNIVHATLKSPKIRCAIAGEKALGFWVMPSNFSRA
jgi:hypothetical protein